MISKQVTLPLQMPYMKSPTKTIRILATVAMGFEDMLIIIHKKANFQSLEGKVRYAVTYSLHLVSSAIRSMQFLKRLRFRLIDFGYLSFFAWKIYIVSIQVLLNLGWQ